VISAAEFHACKPNPSVCLDAARTLGVRPDEIAMAAAHLGNLAAGRWLGMRRPGSQMRSATRRLGVGETCGPIRNEEGFVEVDFRVTPTCERVPARE